MARELGVFECAGTLRFGRVKDALCPSCRALRVVRVTPHGPEGALSFVLTPPDRFIYRLSQWKRSFGVLSADMRVLRSLSGDVVCLCCLKGGLSSIPVRATPRAVVPSSRRSPLPLCFWPGSACSPRPAPLRKSRTTTDCAQNGCISDGSLRRQAWPSRSAMYPRHTAWRRVQKIDLVSGLRS